MKTLLCRSKVLAFASMFITSMFIMNAALGQAITINSVTPETFCANTPTTITINFSFTGFTGNRTFTAQLSNSSGFTTIIPIGATTINTSSNSSGVISGLILQPPGTYFLRVAAPQGSTTYFSSFRCIVVFPTAPILTAPANTCASAFTLPPVTPVPGFNVQYSIDGGAFSASPSTTTPGCHTVQARYVLGAACGDIPAGTAGPAACASSKTVNVVIFPAAPPAPVVSSGCGPFTVVPPPSIPGFNIQYSFDDGGTWNGNTPPSANNCAGYKIRTRYVLAAACGSTPAGTASTNPACAASPATTRIVDTQDPSVTTAEGADTNIGCNPTSTEIDDAFTAPVFADNCGAPTVQVTNTHTGSGCQQSDTRTWTATDACGNSTAVSQTISYTVDTQDPSVSEDEGADTNIGCNPTASQIADAFTAPEFADNCGTPTVQVTNAHTGSGCQQSDTRTWTATDACGNTTAVSQTISYTLDTQDPTVTTAEGEDANIGCNPTASQINDAFTAPVFADNCGAPTVQVTNAHTGSGCQQSDTRTWTATDACGNSTAVSQTISYTVDTQDPSVSEDEGADTNIGCNPTASQISAAFSAPVFADNCGTPTVQVTNTHTGSGCQQSDTRTWTATDACGNSTAVSQTISYTVDTQDPSVTTAEGADTNIGCNPTPSQINDAFTAPVFADNCGAPTVQITNAHTGSGCQQSDTRTWTATDACGNSTAVSQTISYTVDTQDPSVTTAEGADTNIGCNPKASQISAAFSAPVFADNCGTPTVQVTNAHTGSGCQQSDTRTWTATDACGNTTAVSQTISYTVDTQGPTPNCPSNITVAPTTLSGTVVNYNTPTATDNCGGTPSRVQTAGRPSGATFPIGTTTNTFEFTDACGNKSSCTFTVTVTDPYCDNNPRNRKVYVCHNGNTICVSVSSWPEHQAHGDYLGPCTTNQITRSEAINLTAPLANNAGLKSFQVVFAPNPSDADFRLKVESNSNEPINIRVIDAFGRVMMVMKDVQKNSPVVFGENYRSGYYFVEVVQGANHKTVKLIKLK